MEFTTRDQLEQPNFRNSCPLHGLGDRKRQPDIQPQSPCGTANAQDKHSFRNSSEKKCFYFEKSASPYHCSCGTRLLEKNENSTTQARFSKSQEYIYRTWFMCYILFSQFFYFPKIIRNPILWKYTSSLFLVFLHSCKVCKIS